MSTIRAIQQYFNNYYWDDKPDVEPLSRLECEWVQERLKEFNYQPGDFTLVELAVEEILSKRIIK